MKRRHLFEFNEAAWVPASIKTLVTDYLRTLIDWAKPFSHQLPLITQALQRAGKKAGVIDLCSGGGGPWHHLSPQLDRLARRSVPVMLSDKYPEQRAAAVASMPATVNWHAQAVDATAVPAHLTGMRTLFNGFHHFMPRPAVHILSDAVANKAPIIVMEMLRRSPLDLLAVVWTPLLVWVLTPWIRPFSLMRLALTYVVPIAPVMITWDTFVSVLRCYTPQELQQMGQAAGDSNYAWFTGSYRHRGMAVTFLIGYPKDEASNTGGSDD